MTLKEVKVKYGLTAEQYNGLVECARKVSEANGGKEVHIEKVGENFTLYCDKPTIYPYREE